MTNHTDPVALLEQVYDHAEGVLAQVGPDQHELPTPCTEWNVHQLVNHMVGGVHFIASAVAGDEPPGRGSARLRSVGGAGQGAPDGR